MKRIILIVLILIYSYSFLNSQNNYPPFVGSGNKNISYNIAQFNIWKNLINFENQNNRTVELGGSTNTEKNKFRYKQNYSGYSIVDSLNNPIDSNYYDGIYQTFEGLLYVKKSNTIWGAYNENKILIYKPIYKDLYIYNNANYTAISRIDKKFGLVNIIGENLINFDYDYMWPISFSNFIKAKNEAEEYLFNINGTLIAKGSQVTLDKLGEKSIYYVVNQDDKKGIIDFDGNWLVELSEYFEYRNQSKENLNCITYNKNGLKGFVFEKKDFYLIKFSHLVTTLNLMNEPYLLFKDQQKYFLYDINKRCKVISDIEDIYDEFRPKFIKINQKWQRLSLEEVKINYSKIEHFRGLYKVFEGNKCGIINANDSIVLKIKYDLIKSLNNGCIYTLKSGKYEILGPNYLPITKACLDYVDENYKDEVFSRVSIAGKMYLIDKLGNYTKILEKPITETEVNKGSKFKILNNGIFMGLVDSLGNTYLDPIYDLISTMNYKNDSSFLFYVRKGDIRGFYNQDTFFFPIKAESFKRMNDYQIHLRNFDSKCYVLNLKTNKKSKVYDDIISSNISSILYYAKDKGKTILIDTSFKEVLNEDFNFINVIFFGLERYLLVNRNTEVAIYNLKFENIVPFKYNEIESFYCFSKFFAKVRINNKFGIISLKNEELIPVLYDQIYFYKEHIITILDGKMYKYNNNFEILNE